MDEWRNNKKTVNETVCSAKKVKEDHTGTTKPNKADLRAKRVDNRLLVKGSKKAEEITRQPVLHIG